MTSQIVVLGFEGQYIAEGMLTTFESMEERGLLELEDAVVASRGVGQNVEINQTKSLKGKYTKRGSGVGLLAGLLLGGPILGLAGGALIGSIAGSMKDYGIDDKSIQKISDGLKPNSSALFVMVKNVKGKEVLEELSKHEGLVLTTTLPAEARKRLEDALEK